MKLRISPTCRIGVACAVSWLAAAVSLLVVLACMSASDAVARQQADSEYVVSFSHQISDSKQRTTELQRRYGFKVKHVFEHAIEGFSARLNAGQLQSLRRNREVISIVEDRVQFALDGRIEARRAGEATPTGINRLRMGGGLVATVTDRAVAVLDSGVDLDHPDLNVVSGTNCVDPADNADDDNGHGTHVAGTIAARNSGRGVLGMVPGTRIVAVKVLDSAGNGSVGRYLCGLDWIIANAAAQRIAVVNASLGWSAPSGVAGDDRDCGRRNLHDVDRLHAAVCRLTGAGIVMVASAGNRATDLSTQAFGAFNEVITVTAMADTDGSEGGRGPSRVCGGATQTDDTAWTHSNYATNNIDFWHTVAAPGACIVSTWIGGGTQSMSGTSMATPHVAGLVAFCMESFPGWFDRRCRNTPADIRSDIWNASAREPAAVGFSGDPRSPITGRIYSFLASSP